MSADESRTGGGSPHLLWGPRGDTAGPGVGEGTGKQQGCLEVRA